MNKLQLVNDSVLLSPKRLAQPSSWSGHIPFAMWFVAQCKPVTLVELGTHSGNSYFSFCQSVQANGLNTDCYALDTWAGDPQAGYYGDEIYADVRQHNEQHYAGFSKLLRMTFDQAVDQFSDGSIDLLHIDGLHTYEAVLHDFETWRPKLSACAVVLFHDIVVRERNFGVWKLWAELQLQYPHFQFDHSNGLGVLFVGQEQSETIQILLDDLKDPQKKLQFCQFFEQLGRAPSAELEIDNLQRSITEYYQLVQEQQKTVQEQQETVQEKQKTVQELHESIQELKETVQELEQTAQANSQRTDFLTRQVAEKKILQQRIRTLTIERDNLLASTSWRITEPIREVSKKVRHLKGSLLEQLRHGYHRLPLTPTQRTMIRAWVYKSHILKFLRCHGGASIPSSISFFTQAAMMTAPGYILLVERTVPRPNQDAGSVMIANFIRVLRQKGYAVTFIPFDLAYDPEYTPQLQTLGVECLHCPDIGSIEDHLADAGERYDFILSCRPDQTEVLLPLFKSYSPQACLLYETHDLHFVREQRQAEMEQNPELLQHAKWRKKQEMQIAESVDCTLVVSEEERQILLQESAELTVEVIPVIDEIYGCQRGYAQRQDLIFIGGYQHRPNVDAVLYFVEHVLPLIVDGIPEIRFLVVGSHPPEEILALASDNVIVHGFVPDITELMKNVRVSVNPLRFGAGVKGKMVTSMSYGVPCVGSSIAVEGMGLVHGKHALVANGAEDFAAAVLRVYSDQSLWESISTDALDFVRQNFSLQVASDTFERIFSQWSAPTQEKNLLLTRIVSHADYLKHFSASEQRRRKKIETACQGESESITTRGFCFVCDAEVDYHTDFSFAFQQSDGSMVPNWRERMVCPQCRLNNRMRASIHLFHLLCAPTSESCFYLTEQTTPLFSWFKQNYADVAGSEFLGDSIALGAHNSAGIRNENLTELTFAEEQFDAILSFDVFEHIPEYLQALQNCLCCLKTGGSLFFSVPFDLQATQHHVRAEIDSNGKINHLLPPEYHGDPLSDDGCLCYYHFGWELLEQLRNLGFKDASAYLYWSDHYGYLGGEQLIFRAIK